MGHMAFTDTILPILIKFVITIAFVVINAFLLREIVALFQVRDDTMATATAIAVWMGGILFIFSFLTEIRLIGWAVAALINILFIYLIKRYYDQPWKETLLIWETWVSVFIYLAIFIYAFAYPYLT